MLCGVLVKIGLGVVMNLVLALTGALLLSLICEKAEAQVAREAFYSIPSETVSAPDFLMGKEWPRVLNEVGIATFAVDSYAGRGLVNYPADPGKISFLTRVIDAFRALEVVAKEPRIDPSRIAVMGFSQGAGAALYSSMARFQKMYGNPDLQFVGHISTYGICNTRLRDDEDVKKPILMLHGTADDLTPIAPCREYAERLSKAGKSARIIEYPDAYPIRRPGIP